MKMNWGVGIAVAFGVFVMAILALVYTAMTKDVDLVTEQYYDRGIHYQDQINTVRRTRALDESPAIVASPGDIAVRLPSRFLNSGVSGRIVLYRPSDRHKDLSLSLALDSSLCQHIPTATLTHGFWKVQVNWRSEGMDYYSEMPVVVQ